ncbi:hypothetical protein [Pseudomonas hamedanensis]|uniref:Uncharacterized protein n=1 Tax=Pseudomonas hamedanensis TaxID=2745504 RepID=A0A9E6NVL3_9PSED|nr:hypothetical protein [Pseudomonas hamedanensis]QXI15197.1 hypothetical protein HU739_014825 [Pseudomonas hamedanensis]
MPLKPPARGKTTVEVHVQPRPGPDSPTIRPDYPSPHGGGSVHWIPTRTSTGGRTTAGTDLDAITPAPARVTVNATTEPGPAPAMVARPLKDYWIHPSIVLPAPNADGISVYRGRHYVNVPENGAVQVALDPVSGLYQAKLPNELNPSGPKLQSDPESRVWRPVEQLSPATYPLSAARLQRFRSDLDVSDLEPDSHGLYSTNGKLYAVIENHTYQMLHDLDASSPHTTVMRIVRPEDPIATHEHNVYVATRDGSSEPVVFDSRHGWQGIVVPGAAGMRRSAAPEQLIVQRLEAASKLEQFTETINKDHDENQRLIAAWMTARDSQGNRADIVKNEKQALRERKSHNKQELARLDEAYNYYTDNKSVIKALITEAVYNQSVIALQKRQMLAYQQLVECSLTRRALEGPLLDVHPDRLQGTIDFLTRIISRMKARQRIADNLIKKWRLSPDDLSGDILSPMDTHNVVASWVLAKSLTLDNPQSTGTAPQASELAAQFGQATFIYGALDRIPDGSRPAVLSELSGQCAAIRDWYERLDLAPGPQQLASRDEIITQLELFEETLAHRLKRYHEKQTERPALPFHEQPIDFDFIPPQDRSGTAPRPRRIFRAKKHGVYKINVGESRHTAQGEEIIEVRNPLNPDQPLQTYERRAGEWQPVRTPTQKELSTLIQEARQHLAQSDAHVQAALNEERRKNNPDNIVEMLESKANVLDDLVLELQLFEQTDPNAGDLIRSLKGDGKRLRQEGENIRLRIYKDKNFLSAERLIYLIDKGQVRVVENHHRSPRGKGQSKEFLDIYSIHDVTDGKALWQAHFHYATQHAPKSDFNVRGAHLKILEQSQKGRLSQRKEEMEGRKHTPIWREQLDGRTAQRIFDLAVPPRAGEASTSSQTTHNPRGPVAD